MDTVQQIPRLKKLKQKQERRGVFDTEGDVSTLMTYGGEIAKRSRGTPRIGLRLMRRARDFAQVKREGRLDMEVVAEALELEGVDDHGLDSLDRLYLSTLIKTYAGGPAGLEAIAATMGEDPGTLEDVVEPYLLQTGLLMRTPRGRCLSTAGWAYLGIMPPESATRQLDMLSDLGPDHDD